MFKLVIKFALVQNNKIIMSHIHTNPGEHDLAASAFIIRTDAPEPQLLLHVHK